MQLRFDWFNRYPYPYYAPHGWFPRMAPTIQPPYPAPDMPTREGVRERLQASSCVADCGCLPTYDGCFVGCGGERRVETICVANCPPER
jgi:hypothetical protein